MTTLAGLVDITVRSYDARCSVRSEAVYGEDFVTVAARALPAVDLDAVLYGAG